MRIRLGANDAAAAACNALAGAQFGGQIDFDYAGDLDTTVGAIAAPAIQGMMISNCGFLKM